MSALIQFLASKTNQFSIEMRFMNISLFQSWLEKKLVDNPAVVASIDSYSYQIVQQSPGSFRANFSVQYDPIPLKEPVFLSQNLFELVTAVSSSLRLHLSRTILVIDNRKNNVNVNNVFQLLHASEEFVGEELQIHQNRASSTKKKTFFGGRIVVLFINRTFFDTSKDINDLSCLLATQAQQIRQKSDNDIKTILNEIMHWFRDNVEYVNTNRISDHSAVGLIKHGTAVCQGIAAYAYQLLHFCGVDARYVSGEGLGTDGWGPHGWNMVFYDSQWIHIDYTFELNGHSRSVLKDECDFRKKHRWDESRYSPKQSSIVINSKKTLRKSIISFVPNSPCCAINGCVIDMRQNNSPCIIRENRIYVLILKVLSLIGGSFCIDRNQFQVFINCNHYSISVEQLLLINENWYTEISNLGKMGFEIKIEGNRISVRYTA